MTSHYLEGSFLGDKESNRENIHDNFSAQDELTKLKACGALDQLDCRRKLVGTVYEDAEEGARLSLYEKPAISYAAMISQALMSASDKRLTLNGIYECIKDKYPYYRSTETAWQVYCLCIVTLAIYSRRD